MGMLSQIKNYFSNDSKEGNIIPEDVEKIKILENEKSLFGRENIERYFETNNISEELRNNLKFINLINNKFSLECECHEIKEFLDSDFNDDLSLEDLSLQDQKERYEEFYNKQKLSHDNEVKCKHLLNIVKRDINKIVGRDIEIEIVDEQGNGFQEFRTNKELKFEDGSIIKPGTYFIIEGSSTDVGENFNYEIHFEKRMDNVYMRENGTGEGYRLNTKDLLNFTELVEKEEKQNLQNHKEEKNNDHSKDYDITIEAERAYITVKMAELELKPIQGDFDLKHLNKIHKHIFKGIISEAGCLVENEELMKVFDDIKKNNYLKGDSIENLSDKLADYYIKLQSELKDFKGSSVVNREFIRELAGKNGYHLDWNKINDSKLKVVTCSQDKQSLSRIIIDAIENKTPDKELIKQFIDMEKIR